MFQRLSRKMGHYLLLLKCGWLFKSENVTTSPRLLFGNIDDNDWFWLNTEGYRKNWVLRKILPSMPDEKIQVHFTGSVGDASLRDGFSVYKLFKRIFEEYVGDLNTFRTILDFGCGWGRIIRFFLKDVEPSRLWGVDCYEEVLEISKRTNKWCNFQLVKPFPPISFSQDTFDLIYCNSVFSHLAEDAHKKWLAEFQRILKPGGLLIATTWPRDYIETADERKKDLPEWMRSSTPTFPNRKQYLADYDNGNYCYSPTGGGGPLDASFFGETCISKAYVLNHWTKHFTFIDFIDDPSQCAQNVIVVRK